MLFRSHRTGLDPTGQPNADEAIDAPIPITLPDGRTLSRREVLGGIGATAAAVALPSLTGRSAAAASSPAASGGVARRPGQCVLVLVTAYGGNDGLNTIVPTQDAVYTSLRGPAGIAADKTLRIDDRFGFHPSLAGIKALFDAIVGDKVVDPITVSFHGLVYPLIKVSPRI